jgi:CubicO group peptidase (beta-lactamase class C family)
MAEVDLSMLLELLERRRAEGWHRCAQVYVSRHGVVLLDETVGDRGPGRPLRVDDIMLWYSAGKPLTTVAVLQLWERERLGLDDRVGSFLDGWGNGKERCTLRHVLTHTGGFPMYGDPTFDTDLTFAEALAAVKALPARSEPGTEAAYHPASGWRVLGGVVEAVDGRPIERYLQDEILDPLGLASTSLGIPVEEQRRLGDRIVPVVWTGHQLPTRGDDGKLRQVDYRIDRWHNEPWHVAKIEPGGGMRGPARELGRFYEALLGQGPALLEPRTVEVMTAIHRYGMVDRTFGIDLPWGLGVQRQFTGGAGRRAFGHGGMASSRGLCDPDLGLVMVVVANGLAGYFEAEQRNLELTDAVYSALGEDAARVRQPLVPLPTRRFST